MARFKVGATRFCAPWLFSLGALAVAPSASAQSNLGDLLNSGATKVFKAELVAALPLATRGMSDQGSDVYLEFMPDGRLTGQIIVTGGYKSRISDTWTMDGNGEQCIYEKFPDFAGRAPDHTECGRYVFRLNGKFYRARSDTDRNSVILVMGPKR